VVLDLNVEENEAVSYKSTVRRLVDAGRKVIVYTMQDDQDVALACLDLGVCAYVTKAEGHDHLVAATVAAAENRPYLPPALAGAMAANRQPQQPHLSDREREVLTLWFQCESKQLVADRMRITPRTVGTYLDRIRVKYTNVGRPAPPRRRCWPAPSRTAWWTWTTSERRPRHALFMCQLMCDSGSFLSTFR